MLLVCVQTIPPTVPLDKELEALHEFLTHQGAARGPNHREWIGASAARYAAASLALLELTGYCGRVSVI